MNAVTIGPLMFAGDRFAAALAIGAFMMVSAVLSARIDRSLARWSNHALLAGLIAARAGHVIKYFDNFLAEPMRIFAIWQGGFSLAWGIAAILVVTAFHVRSLRVGFASAAALGISFFVWTIASQLLIATVALPVPTHVMEQLDGPRMALTDTGGRPSVVNLWATWCPPCRRELPLLAEMATARKDVAFFFANQGEGSNAVREYLTSEHLNLEHVLLDQAAVLPRHYNTRGIPVTLFLRPDGTLMTAHFGEISREALTENISRFAKQSAESLASPQ